MIKEKIIDRSERLASVGELAAGVAHEIGNSLFIIMGNTQILLSKIEKEDSRREELEIIEKVTDRCAKTVEVLLEYSRFSKSENRSININRLIEDTLPLIAHQSFLRQVKIKKRFAPDLPKISVDSNHLRQVFVNLILNAKDAMPQGGGLIITTRSTGSDKFVKIEFKDTGCGIAPENIPKLFNPFFTTKESNGTGLGLSISQRIIKNYKGKIEVKSKIGKGSTFTVKLPVR